MEEDYFTFLPITSLSATISKLPLRKNPKNPSNRSNKRPSAIRFLQSFKDFISIIRRKRVM